MKLDGLIPIYRKMKQENVLRYRFNYTYKNVEFDVFFLADDSPFVLMFGVKKENFYFELKVKKGFIINYYLEKSIYYQLCKILKLKHNPDNPFSPEVFFRDFNSRIPTTISINHETKPHEIAYYRDDVEEAEKIYF